MDEWLQRLSQQRPIFHSEADFQHALAWLIHLQLPVASIRLEYLPLPSEPLHLDLWVERDQHALAIELKYPSRRLMAELGGEQFTLKSHDATDQIRYDFIKDIGRLERIVLARPSVTGYAILLTNDSGFWTLSARSDTVDAAFRLHEGARLNGSLAWAAHASAGTKKTREAALELRGSYLLSWHDYSTVGTPQVAGRFRYLLVRVDRNAPLHSN